jgi:hypothetical protein
MPKPAFTGNKGDRCDNRLGNISGENTFGRKQKSRNMKLPENNTFTEAVFRFY